MPRKVFVENSKDKLKKTVAALLVRRLLAVWVIPNVMIRRLSVNKPALDVRSCRIQTPHRVFIPEKLPPVEIGGCHFQGPTPAEVFPPSHYAL